MSMKKYAVSYLIPYVHRVTVGIQAHSKRRAIAHAEQAFDAGTIWDDTPSLPLLEDEFHEQGEGHVLTFEAQCVDVFDANYSVIELRRQRSAKLACQQLVEAYSKAEADGGSIDWADIDAAHALALEAVSDS